MPISMATITEAKPTTSDRRVPYMIELSTSRPWSSVPSGNVHSPSGDSSTGGFSPSLRLSVAGSNGVCGARTGDRKATTTMNKVAAAATTVIDDDLKLHQMSLSAARCSQSPNAERLAERSAERPSERPSERLVMSVPAGTRRAGAAQPRIDSEVQEIDR